MAVTGAPLLVVVAVAAGYLIGSIPVAALVTGRDLRTVGDRNPGYWNAKETLGRRAALPVFAGDVAKGAAAAGIGVLCAQAAGDGRWWIGYAAAAAAMIGHAWPVFAGFRGGRSILTFAGAMIVLAPSTAAIAIAVCIVVSLVTRSFAIGARVGVFGVPVVQIVVEGAHRTAATGCLMCIIGLRFAMAAWGTRARAT